MHPPVMCHELQQRPATGNQYHQQSSQSGGKVMATSSMRAASLTKIFITGICGSQSRSRVLTIALRQHPGTPSRKYQKSGRDTVTRVLGQGLKGSRTPPGQVRQKYLFHDAGHLFSLGFQRKPLQTPSGPHLSGFSRPDNGNTATTEVLSLPRMQQSCLPAANSTRKVSTTSPIAVTLRSVCGELLISSALTPRNRFSNPTTTGWGQPQRVT